MKKWIAMLLAALMVFSMAACAAKNEPAADQTNDQTAADTQTSEPAEDTASGEDAAPAADQTAADSDMAYVQSKGTLVVGITDFAPMDYQNESGEWIGFDADMAKAFAESLGVSVEFVEIDWDNKILELGSKSIDCVWNGMTLTDEVLNAMECTAPYLVNAQVVVMKSDKVADYADVDAMKDLAVAVESGSAGDETATNNGFTNVTKVTAQADALMEVASGTADACIIDLTMAKAMTGDGTSYADLSVAAEMDREEYGIGFRKGSDMAQKVNDIIASLKDDGTLQALADKYGLSLID